MMGFRIAEPLHHDESTEMRGDTVQSIILDMDTGRVVPVQDGVDSGGFQNGE